MTRSRKATRVAAAACVALFAASAALAFIDPDRPASWLVGESKAIAELKIAAVDGSSATFSVVRVMKGKLAAKEIAVRWTGVQQPPVAKASVGAAAVLLVPADDEDPTLVHVGPEYLSVKPDAAKPGEYEFLRLNGFVKGSFNGESADLAALIDDILHKRAYFPIEGDTTFAAARQIGDLPDGARALAVGDLEGKGELDIVAATAKGLVAFAPDGKGGYAAHALEGIGPAGFVQLADVDGDGRCEILTGAGLFTNKGGWRFAADGLNGKAWTSACFCGSVREIAAVEAGRAELFVRSAQGAWADVTAERGLDAAPANVAAMSACLAFDWREIVVVTPGALVCLEAAPGKRFATLQTVKLPALTNVCIVQRDLDGDGIPDVFIAADGYSAFFRRATDRTLAEVPDHLGDVRKMFGATAGVAALVAGDFNNDGLTDIVAASKSSKVSLVMNRGYHNLREGTEIFDLPMALKDVGEVDAVAAGDFDGDGDLDLVVASGKSLYVLSNTFETKPAEANDRPRHPLLTVRAPGKLGALVTIEDGDGKPIASQCIGEGPVADVVYFGYRDAEPATVSLVTVDGSTARGVGEAVEPGKPVVFKVK